MKKRMISIVCVLCMIFTLLPTTAFAAPYNAPTLNIATSFDSTTNQITVTVSLGAYTDLAAMDFHLLFDNTKLTVNGTPTEKGVLTNNSTVFANTDNIGVAWCDEKGSTTTEATDILIVVFDVIPGQTGDVEFSFDPEITNFCDITGENGTDTAGSGSVLSASVTIPKAPIAAATASIDAPSKGAALDTTVDTASATTYTAGVEWFEGSSASGSPVTGNAKADQVYTAKITLTPASGESFASSVTMSGTVTGAATPKGGNLVLTKTFPATAGAGALGGTVSVTGTPTFGQTLTADTSGLTYAPETAGTLSYKWYRGDAVITGATGSTYTLVAEDVGKTIKVEVSNSNNSGSVTSAPTAAVAKADCTASAVAATVSATDNSVTVTNITSGQEYAICNGAVTSGTPTDLSWKDSGTFTGLVANNPYTVFTRVKETATTKASVTKSTTTTTAKATQTISGPDTYTLRVGSSIDLSTMFSSNAAGATLTYTEGTALSGTSLSGSTVTAGTTEGTYAVKVNSAAVGDYEAAAEKTITITVSNKLAQTLTDFAASSKTYTYGDTPETQTVNVTTGDGALSYSSSDSAAVSVDSTTGALTIHKATTSPVTITATAAETADYAPASKTYTVTVDKKELEITGLAATDRDYDGTTNVALTGGTLSGIVASDDVACTIPTSGTMANSNAGNNKPVDVVTPTLNGSSVGNYTLKTISGITVTINKADPAIGAVTYTGLTLYPSTAPASVTLTRANTSVAGTLALDGVTALTEGTSDYNWKFTPGDTTNYKTVTGTISLTVAADALVKIESTAPTKTAYKYGEDFEIAGATVTATFESGNTLDVTDAVTFGALAVGDTSVELTYVSGDVTKTCTVSGITVSKADAKTLTNKTATHKIGLTAEQTMFVTGLMPSDAGTLTYTAGSKTDAGGIISAWSVTADGTVKYTLSDTGAAGNTATLAVTIGSDNYEDSAVNVVITLTEKDIPTVSANPITETYTGTAISADKITGTASVDGAWSFKAGAPVNVADSDTYTVVFTPTDAANYETVETDIQVTISKATPAGTPAFTKITSSGKTLADAALAIGTITPADGTIAWDDEDTTAVSANTSYAWTYTPADTANYNNLTGSLKPYTTSSSSGGGGGSSVSKYTLTFETNGGSKVDSVSKASGTSVDLASYKPTKDGFEFDGWYSDKKLTEKVTSVKLNKDTTVYAKWAEQPAASFTDVPAGAYYEEAVKWAVDEGITSGTSATTFNPNGTCTRAQAVTFLWRAAGSPKMVGAMNPFSDVKADSYYADAVLWALDKGITTGTSSTTFSPNAECSRAQIVTFLWRSAGNPVVDYAMSFQDVSADSYYAEAVRWAVSEKITAGTSTDAFSPNASCTRAQIVTFLWRGMK